MSNENITTLSLWEKTSEQRPMLETIRNDDVTLESFGFTNPDFLYGLLLNYSLK